MEKTVFYKIWRLFRLTFTVYLSLYYFSASAQVARLSLNMQQVPLQQVMDEIKKQTKYLFINQDVDTDRKVSINVENQIISEVLNQLFTPINVGYRIEQINIYVYNNDCPLICQAALYFFMVALCCSNSTYLHNRTTDQSMMPHKKEARYQLLTAGHRKPDTENCPAPKLALLKF